MKVDALVFNWRGHTARAEALERELRRQLDPQLGGQPGQLTRVTVINSDEEAVAAHPHWVHLGEDAYFSAQWNKAVELFSGDLLFHMQADASCRDLPGLVARAVALFSRLPLGVYEPDINYNALNYDRKQLPAVEPRLHQVPMTDCTCWFIHREVVRAVPRVDASVNKYGWGICTAMAAAAQLQEKLCVRDYSVKVLHPRSRGYSSDLAAEHAKSYRGAMPPELREKMASISKEMRRAIANNDRKWRRIRSLLSWRGLRGKLLGRSPEAPSSEVP